MTYFTEFEFAGVTPEAAMHLILKTPDKESVKVTKTFGGKFVVVLDGNVVDNDLTVREAALLLNLLEASE